MCAKYNPEYDPIPYEAVDAVINMPDVPETINSDTLSNLYCDCVYAFWNACANAKELLTNPIKRGTAGELKEVLKLKALTNLNANLNMTTRCLPLKRLFILGVNLLYITKASLLSFQHLQSKVSLSRTRQ